jgi:hypothetical protein
MTEESKPNGRVKRAVSFGVFTVREEDDHHSIELVAPRDVPLLGPITSQLFGSELSTMPTASSLDTTTTPLTAPPSCLGLDLTTGQITLREQIITEVTVDEQEARSPWAKVMGLRRRHHEDGDSGNADMNAVSPTTRIDDSNRPNRQFRIRSRVVLRQGQRRRPRHIVLAWWFERTTAFIANHMAWTYRASFATVIVVVYLWYMAIAICFAVLIHLEMLHQPACLSSVDYGFMDAFHLSWTTLATVGYGVAAPTMATAQQRWYVCVCVCVYVKKIVTARVVKISHFVFGILQHWSERVHGI